MQRLNPIRFLAMATAILFTMLYMWVDVNAQVTAPNEVTAPYFVGLPPLGRGCGNWGLPLNSVDPVCCVSGYIYFEGTPVAGADVAITNGIYTRTVTSEDDVDTLYPYYGARLDDEPMRVKPGDLLTVTATYSDVVKSATFIARAGGQQVDVVLSTPKRDSAWVGGNLSGRFDHALAYDPIHKNTILFGGTNVRSELLNDTWLWDGTRWIAQLPANSPPVRYGHTLIYDQQNQRMMMFGGKSNSGSYYQDLWAWAGNSWGMLPSNIVPPARAYHAMAYDPVRQRIIVFGGANAGGALNDTWEWDGATWLEKTSSNPPPKRLRHSLVYDLNTSRVLLFGGQTDLPVTSTKLADFWSWDGTTWLPITSTTSPPALSGHSAAYDTQNQQVLLFGGRKSDDEDSNQLWSWNGLDWSQVITTPVPLARFAHRSVFDEERKQMLVVGGYAQSSISYPDLADTWAWNGSTWIQANRPFTFTRWQGVASAHEHGGQMISFGGLAGSSLSGSPQDITYRWSSEGITTLTTIHTPTGRWGHRLSRNADGSKLLMFGGVGPDGFFLDDTWTWNGNDWTEEFPNEHPSPRGYYSLAYDVNRGLWVLWGGQDEEGTILDDLWEFNGTTWIKRTPEEKPSARRLATLTYDAARKRIVLFGGHDGDSYPNDIWEWDGTNWIQQEPVYGPSGRSGHGATYDPTVEAIVIAGGRSPLGTLSDTWQWNGSFWRRRLAIPNMQHLDMVQMEFVDVQQRIVAVGNRAQNNLAGEGIWIHQIITKPADALPIASIQYTNKRDAQQGEDTLIYTGFGSDPDASDYIAKYQWESDGVVLQNESILDIAASELQTGTHIISFKVQDDEGNWSQPVTKTVLIRAENTGSLPTNTPTWTFLLYVVGDNNLETWLGDFAPNGLIHRLKKMAGKSNVQFGILFDGQTTGDTLLYTVNANSQWTSKPLAELGLSEPLTITELNTGEMETLSRFVVWGIESLPSDYVMLAFIDHANGVVGFGEDQHDASGVITDSILSPVEIRTALSAAVEESGRKLDIVFFDGCSFGLLENASIIAGLAYFMIVSPNTGWGTFRYEFYRIDATLMPAPRDLAVQIATRYAIEQRTKGRPFTISVFDMSRFQGVLDAVSNFGLQLAQYIKTGNESANKQMITQIRQVTQKYDSGLGSVRHQIDPEDAYLDLYHFASNVQISITTPLLVEATVNVKQSIESFAFEKPSASGYLPKSTTYVALKSEDALGGVGIYYPLLRNSQSLDRYKEHELFYMTKTWGWLDFLFATLPAQSTCLEPDECPDKSIDSLIEPLFPEDEDPLPTPSPTQETVYLPLITR